MNWTAFAAWAALALSGLATGALAARWNSSGTAIPSRLESIMLAAAAAAVIAWFANAGGLLTNSASNGLLAFVPTDASPGFRLATLWSTLPGSALTLGVAALVCVVVVPTGGSHRPRFAALLSAIALVALGVAAWFAPEAESSAKTLAPFLQSPAAALAPLCALVSLIALAVFVAGVGANHPVRGWSLLAWTASTAAIAAEQVARTQLGIGPRDGIVLGSAAGGLLLWLVTSALLHRRVQSWLRIHSESSGNRQAVLASHAGALLVALSFGVHAMASRSTVALAPGQTVSLTDAFGRQWQLANQGISRFDAGGADITAAAIETRAPSGQVTLLSPELRDHHRADGTHLDDETAVRQSTGRVLMALRVLLVDADSLDVARIRVTFQPVPLLWLAGAALLFLSAVLMATAPSRPLPPVE